MATWNPDLLHKYFAPEMARFTVCDAPDLENDHPQAPHWIANHFLNSVFRAEYKNKYRQYAINILLRAQTSFARYHEARRQTLDYLARGSPAEPAVRHYFSALSSWEAVVLNLQIFIDVLNRIKREDGQVPVFTADDGSPEQRAYSLANQVKHWGSEISAGRHDENHTVPIWLTNAGLQCRDCTVSFPEIATLVSEAADIASKFQDPTSWSTAN